jgi:hypothetical protein
MSTAGIYNYRPKVDNPNKMFHQMDSDTSRPPFYFGGSQVPINLHIEHYPKVKTPYEFSQNDIYDIPMVGHGLGVGLKTTHRKNDNIRMPKLLFHK